MAGIEIINTHVYSDFLVGTELRPIPRLSKAQTSTPASPPSLGSSSGDSSSFGLTVPTRPFICGPQESWVPANPEDSSRKLQSETPFQFKTIICWSSRKPSQTHEIRSNELQFSKKLECVRLPMIIRTLMGPLPYVL